MTTMETMSVPTPEVFAASYMQHQAWRHKYEDAQRERDSRAWRAFFGFISVLAVLIGILEVF